MSRSGPQATPSGALSLEHAPARVAPRATYRLQLSPRLTFDGATELLPYLAELGVSHLYLSPIMQARVGSTHGYDVIDPTVVSRELGGEAGFRALASAAHDAGIGVIVDFVPNHMIAGDENPYWRDPKRRAKFFDIDRARHWHRRFFTIDELAGVRVEDPEVFEETHRKVLELSADGLIDGLRIDHIDGLTDPAGYLERLRGRGVHSVWVEKILEHGEELRDWPVHGTTGYDFANDVTAVFIDGAGEQPLTDLYAEITGSHRSFAQVAAEAKREQVATAFQPEIGKLRSLYDHPKLEDAVASLPVYRTYVQPYTGHVEQADRDLLAAMPSGLREVLLLEDHGRNGDAPRLREFVARFQQTTVSVIAKGVEDTAFYRYLRLVALNEVGGDPGRFWLPVDAFHRASIARAARWPQSLLASETHDTKRSGDVRARIGVLAQFASEWARLVRRWRELNRPLRDGPAPEPHEEYLIYQTLVGAWPITPDRLVEYVEKALREAKCSTGWDEPDRAWERSVEAFATGLLEHQPFLESFEPFVAQVMVEGESVSLGALLLRLTCPGVPDIYQGDEQWSLELVDPDNRRPVDWDALRASLRRVGGVSGLLGGDAPERRDRKIHVIREVLALRARRPEPFAGDYVPLSAPPEICAFTRGGEIAVIVGLRRDALVRDIVLPGAASDWREIAVDPSGTAPIRLLERERGA